MYRENGLDRLVCTIRDCFDENKYGYPISADGVNKLDICFERRRSKTQVMAHMWTSKLPRFLEEQKTLIETDKEELKDLVGPTGIWSTEALFAYEYTSDEDVFQSCHQKWVSVLQNIFEVDPTTIEKLMREQQNTLTLSNHNQVIENIDKVVKTLKSPFDSYLRINS